MAYSRREIHSAPTMDWAEQTEIRSRHQQITDSVDRQVAPMPRVAFQTKRPDSGLVPPSMTAMNGRFFIRRTSHTDPARITALPSRAPHATRACNHQGIVHPSFPLSLLPWRRCHSPSLEPRRGAASSVVRRVAENRIGVRMPGIAASFGSSGMESTMRL